MRTARTMLWTLTVIFLTWFCVMSFALLANATLTGIAGHDRYIYPVVRVSDGSGSGSGTILYSKASEKDGYSTYILTNYHVISGSIKVVEKFDADLGEDIKVEKRSICYVEIFKYRDLSTPVGTLKVEADIVIHTKDQDLALLKLRTEDKVKIVAQLLNKGQVDDIRCLDETVAVGCSLAFPPLPTFGILTRKNFQLDSLPYHMSSSQIIYGNSGGAMFDGTGNFIGVPSRLAIAGWSTPITHMGLFIPVSRVYEWLEEEHYDFIYDSLKNEKECLEVREKEIEEKKKK